MTFTIIGPPRTKKTSNRLVRVRGRHRVLPSKANETWTNAAVLQLRAQHVRSPLRGGSIDWNVNCRALFYRDARRGDATGYYQAVADALQAAGVLINDVCIVSWDGSRLFVDKACPRVEITLEPAA